MDDQVLRGMAKWPDVPAVFGWLALDRRGNWLIKGDPVSNPAVTAFIGRNYERDGEGRWFFQNGPQRVFVTLDYTPIVYRLASGERSRPTLETHTGARATSLSGAWIDDTGAMLVETEHGPGVVHDHDLDGILSALCDAHGDRLAEDTLEHVMALLQEGGNGPLWLKYGAAKVKVEPLRSKAAPARFGFEPRPAAREGETACD